MIRKIQRGIEERMNGIADDLVDHAAMLHDDGRHPLDVLVEYGDQLFGTGTVRHRGKVLDVGEQRGDFARSRR